MYSYSCDQRIVPSRRHCHRPSSWRIWTYTCQIHRFPTWQLGKFHQIFHHSGFYRLDFCTLRRFSSLQKPTNNFVFKIFTKCGTIFWLWSVNVCSTTKLRWLKNSKKNQKNRGHTISRQLRNWFLARILEKGCCFLKEF